jgi:hypothetical protein
VLLLAFSFESPLSKAIAWPLARPLARPSLAARASRSALMPPRDWAHSAGITWILSELDLQLIQWRNPPTHTYSCFRQHPTTHTQSPEQRSPVNSWSCMGADEERPNSDYVQCVLLTQCLHRIIICPVQAPSMRVVPSSPCLRAATHIAAQCTCRRAWTAQSPSPTPRRQLLPTSYC